MRAFYFFRNILLISLILVIQNYAATPVPKVFVQIEIPTPGTLLVLKNLGISVNLYTEKVAFATIATSELNQLTANGLAITILDQEAWSEPYYCVTHPLNLPVKSLPALGKLIYQQGEIAIIKIAETQAEQIQQAGFQIARLFPRPLFLLPPATEVLSRELQILGPDSVIAALVQRVNDGNLSTGLQRLQDFQTRYSGSDSIYAASAWLFQQFSDLGYAVTFDTLDSRVQGKIQRNVIATKLGTETPNHIVMLGGHYDSIVLDGTNSLIWAPGVDDNGTGTIAALEIARILANVELKSTVKFVCWAAEEQGLIGSADWVWKARQKALDIVVYLNFDMIANVNRSDPLRNVKIYTNQASRRYADLLQAMTLRYTTLVPQIESAGGGSDHFPFHQQGYLSVFGAEGDFSPNWHKRTDTIDNVDIPYFNEVVRSGLATLVQVAGPPPQLVTSYIAYSACQIDDDNAGQSKGNQNGFIDAGEEIEILVYLKNMGNKAVPEVQATLQSDDVNVQIPDSQVEYGDLAAGDSSAGHSPFLIRIKAEAPNNHILSFRLKIRDAQANSWNNSFDLKIQSPELKLIQSQIQEEAGDGDQIPEAGETCRLIVSLENAGFRSVRDLVGKLECHDPDIILKNSSTSFPDAVVGELTRNLLNPFTISLKSRTLPHLVTFSLQLTEGTGYYHKSISLYVLLGQGPVLLVMDDGVINNYRPYQEAFNRLGIPFQQWSNQQQGLISVDSLKKFETVVWAVGYESRETLSEAEITLLKAYIDGGGKLLLSGDYISFRLRQNLFLKDYLAARFASAQTQIYQLTCVPANPLTALDTLALTRRDKYWPVEIDPLPPAFSILKYQPNPRDPGGRIYSTGTAAQAVTRGNSKIIFCSFSIEAIAAVTTRSRFIMDALSWLKGTPLDQRPILELDRVTVSDDSLGASIGDGDGFINPGEFIELIPRLANRGTLAARHVTATLTSIDSWVTILDSVAWSDAILPDSSVNADEFLIEVAATAPHNHFVHFQVTLVDSTQNRWLDSLSLVIQWSNTVTGQVVDVGSGQGLPTAKIYWRTIVPDPDLLAGSGELQVDATGHFQLALPIGSYYFQAYAPGFLASDERLVTLPPDILLDFQLTSPLLVVRPDSITLLSEPGVTYQDTLFLANVRTGKLFFGLLEMATPPVLAEQKPALKSIGKKPSVPMITTKSQAVIDVINEVPPDPQRWQLRYWDPADANAGLDLEYLYIQNDTRNIFFKQTVHQSWKTPATDFAYLIFIDPDLDFKTGASVNNIGADYAVTVGSQGNFVLQWSPADQQFYPLVINPNLQYLLLPNAADSLEIGIRLAQIGNPARIQFVVLMLDANQMPADVAPDDGLYHIPYSIYDASWLTVNPVYGAIESGKEIPIIMDIRTGGLTLEHYFAYLLIENNQPESPFRVVPIHLKLTTTAVQEPVSQALPQTFELEQNFPNPFQGNSREGAETTMKYQLPQVVDVTIRIFNMLGQEVVTLDLPAQMPGYHQVKWNGQLPDGRYAASGLYFYQIQAGPFHSTKKMLLVY